ncbi:MAG: hypothetical protein KKC02_09825, partial [Gammaproteobacteria bacterium]|nr:hypothetical protein [Gammaproteobacteria bacterium]
AVRRQVVSCTSPATRIGAWQVVEKRRRGRQDKAKIGEEAEFTVVNEHSEPVFNAVLPTQVVSNDLPELES